MVQRITDHSLGMGLIESVYSDTMNNEVDSFYLTFYRNSKEIKAIKS